MKTLSEFAQGAFKSPAKQRFITESKMASDTLQYLMRNGDKFTKDEIKGMAQWDPKQGFDIQRMTDDMLWAKTITAEEVTTGAYTRRVWPFTKMLREALDHFRERTDRWHRDYTLEAFVVINGQIFGKCGFAGEVYPISNRVGRIVKRNGEDRWAEDMKEAIADNGGEALFIVYNASESPKRQDQQAARQKQQARSYNKFDQDNRAAIRKAVNDFGKRIEKETGLTANTFYLNFKANDYFERDNSNLGKKIAQTSYEKLTADDMLAATEFEFSLSNSTGDQILLRKAKAGEQANIAVRIDTDDIVSFDELTKGLAKLRKGLTELLLSLRVQAKNVIRRDEIELTKSDMRRYKNRK